MGWLARTFFNDYGKQLLGAAEERDTLFRAVARLEDSNQQLTLRVAALVRALDAKGVLAHDEIGGPDGGED